MMQKFMVIAMPRSRTYWMSKLFDAEHDFIQDEEDLNDFLDCPETRGCITCRPLDIVGAERLSEARIAIVDRDPVDVYSSLAQAFPEELTEPLSGVYLEQGTQLHYDALQEIKDSGDYPTFYYEELGDNEVIKELWEWLMPDTPVDEEKIEMFQDTVLKVEDQRCH